MATDSLDGRVALVTGAGRGIGLAIARRLGGLGAKVVVADNGTGIDGRGENPAVAEAAAAEIGGVPFTASMAEAKNARRAVELAVSTFGGLDLVVINAAILRDALVFKGPPEDFDAVLRNNLSAAYYLLNAATPAMRDQAKAGRGGEAGWGAIVNVVSTAGLYGNYGQSAYAAAKAGLVGLTRVVALEMVRSRVTCNAVAPFAATRVTESIKPANEAQAAYKERALQVPAEPAAEIVAWLCGPFARSVSGQLFGVRGREVLLFSQPRPVAEIVAENWDGETLSRLVQERFAPRFTDLSTDLEAFAGPHSLIARQAMDRLEVKSAHDLAKAPREYRDACRKIVASHAVNELYGAQVFDEPAIALAPNPYAKWLTCRVAMEEYGHHVRFRELGEEMGVAPERMTPAARRPLSIFEFPLNSWAEFAVIKMLADLAEIMQVEDLTQCSFVPLRNLARMTMPEERFHAQFGLDCCAELCQTAAGRAAVQDAIDRYFPLLPAFFGRPGSKNNEIYRKWGIKRRSNEVMLADFLERARDAVEGLGLRLPDVGRQ